MRFKQAVIEYSFKHGVTKAAIWLTRPVTILIFIPLKCVYTKFEEEPSTFMLLTSFTHSRIFKNSWPFISATITISLLLLLHFNVLLEFEGIIIADNWYCPPDWIVTWLTFILILVAAAELTKQHVHSNNASTITTDINFFFWVLKILFTQHHLPEILNRHAKEVRHTVLVEQRYVGKLYVPYNSENRKNS